jgi:hypothetical protein
MSGQVLGGSETEYAFWSLEERSRADWRAREQACGRLIRRAQQTLSCLPGHISSGLFLANGGRLYSDQGHPEYASPEVSDPWQMVRYAQAGDRLVAELAAGVGAAVARGNVDYSGTLATYGDHESYLYSRTDVARLADQIIPHLVSRVIYTGCGGLNPASPGIEFTLSPRATCHINDKVSSSSTAGRAIVHTRDEPLCGGSYKRLHLICGEGLMSQRGIFLRFGVTALVVTMADYGISLAAGVHLRDPVKALHIYAADPTCRAVAETSDGRQLSALQIQRHILAAIRAHAGRSFMPEWTQTVADAFEQTLNRLENGAGGVNQAFDWAIKWEVYADFLSNHRLSWEQVDQFNQLLHRTGLRGTGVAGRMLRRSTLRDPVIAAMLMAERPPEPASQADAIQALCEQGVTKEEAERFLAARSQLCELDLRFGQLDAHGIFNSLVRAGVLDTEVEGVGDIETAMREPPPGRAAVRGQWIRELAGPRARAACEWDRILDLRTSRWLDLRDPFGRGADWLSIAAAEEAQSEPLTRARQLRDLHDLYREGNFGAAAALMESLRAHQHRLSPGSMLEFRRHMSWIQARRGYIDSLPLLDALYRDGATTLSACTDYMQALRFRGLRPHPDIAIWVQRGQHVLAGSGNARSGDAVLFHEYWAHHCLAEGHNEQARDLLTTAYRDERNDEADPRILARLLCGWAEANRRLGNNQRALLQLRRAEHIQLAGEFRGDWANFNLICRAKIEPDARAASHLLKKAKSIQTEYEDRVGLARTLLLEARLTTRSLVASLRRTALLRLRDELPALAACPLLAKILDNWRDWARGSQPDEQGDRFWGV